ncbi:hypothetical protein [Micromonospora carbonacea]|uniref:Uncharacterized protein n=1 Tax=Micromonospora carbonacea TaxID=47853 RepID=A0A1C5A776_9ACTN|nr:hypothetical protein [Micromonospora carbonacea]SCF40921.1 hypothetical protein GA0070563_111221 [Micromonospora carbonacea]
MRDDHDVDHLADLAFAERMRRDLRDVRWLEPAQIRARARRRSRRTALAAATAVLAVLSAFAVAAGGRAGPLASPADRRPAPDGAAPAGRAEIPQEALLDRADLGAPSNVRLGDSGLQEPIRIDPLLQSCAAAQGLEVDTPVSRYSRSQTLFQRAAPEQDQPGDLWVFTQDVYRVSPRAASRLFPDLNEMVTACVGWREVAPLHRAGQPVTVSVTHTWQTVARDFAGDQAVLLRHTGSTPVEVATTKPLEWKASRETKLLVRVGDLVTVIVPGSALGVDGPEGDRWTSDAELLDLGRTAARRMCLAANPAC